MFFRVFDPANDKYVTFLTKDFGQIGAEIYTLAWVDEPAFYTSDVLFEMLCNLNVGQLRGIITTHVISDNYESNTIMDWLDIELASRGIKMQATMEGLRSFE